MDDKKLKDAVSRIKSFFTDLTIDEQSPVEFKEMELQDGTKVKVSGEFVEGALITVVNVDGSEMPAPDGEHVMKDGAVVTVKDGAIVSIVPPVQEAPAVEEDMNEKFDALTVSYAELKSKYDDLLKSTTESKFEQEKFSKDLKSLQEIQKETFSIVEQLAGLPSHEAVEEKPSRTQTKFDKFAQIGKTLQEIKKH